jgi:hypothetical protein
MRAVVAWLVACAGPSLSGAVTDGEGRPVAGATLALSTVCVGVTAADGTFYLPCAAGAYDVTVSAPGYLDAVAPVTLDGPVTLGPTRLIALPTGDGSYLLDGHRFVPAARAGVTRVAADGPPRTKAFCVPAGAAGNDRPAGVVSMFRRKEGELRAFRLDSDDCAHRSVWEAGEWKEASEPPIAVSERRLAYDASLITLDLAAGRWFIAEWDQGWFADEGAGDASSFPGFVVETR